MNIQDLYSDLVKGVEQKHPSYKIKVPVLFVDDISGNKLAYYQHGTHKIVIHEHYTNNGSYDELVNTLKHELAHAIAEALNTGKKRVWHGDLWKQIHSDIGGDASRYHKGGYIKPAPVKKTMQELFNTQPVHPAERWEQGTFNQWLRRGYHVIKGQHGTFKQWEFVADEYETEQDGKTSNYGRASAVYFTPEQVEPNKRSK